MWLCVALPILFLAVHTLCCPLMAGRPDKLPVVLAVEVSTAKDLTWDCRCMSGPKPAWSPRMISHLDRILSRKPQKQTHSPLLSTDNSKWWGDGEKIEDPQTCPCVSQLTFPLSTSPQKRVEEIRKFMIERSGTFFISSSSRFLRSCLDFQPPPLEIY